MSLSSHGTTEIHYLDANNPNGDFQLIQSDCRTSTNIGWARRSRHSAIAVVHVDTVTDASSRTRGFPESGPPGFGDEGKPQLVRESINLDGV